MNRTDHLLKRLHRSMSLIEVGPSHQPLVPKQDGWRTTVVDHASRADLAAKYADHGIDLSRLEEVDVIWSGGDLAALFPPAALGSYDAIVASHVVEHMPDPISFFKSAEQLLKPSGFIVLAMPDKRYSFDFFAPMTSTADWLTAHDLKARTHPKRVAFNHIAYAASHAGQISWGHTSLNQLRLVHTLEDAAFHFASATNTGDGGYVDYHAWRFTPSSLMLVVLESAILCDIGVHVIECTPPLGHEFFMVIGQGRSSTVNGEQVTARRLDLLKAAIGELRQQTDMLLGQ